MPVQQDCPEIECWLALFADTVPEPQRERYEQHLERCLACQERLHRAEDCSDALCQMARQIGDPTLRPADPTLRQFLDRLHESTGPHQGGSAEPPDLYFLHPTDRPGVLGMLGEYEVQEVIGQGGMGVVLKAFDPALNRLVAIKVPAAVAGSAVARKRFTREAQAAAAVWHDHIVAVHGVHEADGLPYLVMQYVEGESLQDRIDRIGPLELEEVVRIGMQTASGLAAAHAQGLIHRDIKPANLLLENGLARVKITDFGLARMVDDVGLTQNGVVAGTPEYMAPEQARGEAADHRADLFSLGSVLYAMCTGVPPFRASNAVAALRQVSDHTPTAVCELNPDVPAWLETLIVRLMAKEPADRFQSAAEVAALLAGCLAHLHQPTTVPVPDLPPSPPDGAKRQFRYAGWLPRLVVLAAAALVAVVILLKGLWAQTTPSSEQPQADFYQDFRDNKPLSPSLSWTGQDGKEVIEPENKGLRVKLTAQRTRKDPVGLELTSPLKGNFEITAGYEIVQADQPRSGIGVGFELYLRLQSPDREGLGFLRVKKVDGNDLYQSLHIVNPNGNLRAVSKYFPVGGSRARSRLIQGPGRLRITRYGTEAVFSVAEGAPGEFRELCRRAVASADLEAVRVAAFPGNAVEPVDVRLLDLQVRTVGPEAVQDRDASSPSADGPGETRWLAVGLFAGGGIAALVLVCVWMSVRRRRQTEKQSIPETAPDNPLDPKAAVQHISVSCIGCGKALRVKGALAGKKIRCTGCGKAVLVPASAP